MGYSGAVPLCLVHVCAQHYAGAWVVSEDLGNEPSRSSGLFVLGQGLHVGPYPVDACGLGYHSELVPVLPVGRLGVKFLADGQSHSLPVSGRRLDSHVPVAKLEGLGRQGLSQDEHVRLQLGYERADSVSVGRSVDASDILKDSPYSIGCTGGVTSR